MDGVNRFLKWLQSTEDGYSQVSVVFGRLHRNHVRTASLFFCWSKRGTVITQKGKKSKLTIKFYGQKKKFLMTPKTFASSRS